VDLGTYDLSESDLFGQPDPSGVGNIDDISGAALADDGNIVIIIRD
jgi:hypothetical protein